MKTSDIGSSLFLMVFGGFIAWQSMELSLGVLGAPGTGFFPFYLGLLLIGLALIIFIQGVRQKPGVSGTGLSKSRVIMAVVAILAYTFILEPLGYLLSTFCLMFLLIRMMVKKAWWFAPGVAGLFSLASYILFNSLLKVLLPGGIFGF